MDSDAEERFGRWAAGRIGPLHRTAYLLCGDWHVAEDLVQDTLARVALHWKRVEAADHPDAYVRQILANQAKQRMRRRAGSEPPVQAGEQLPVPDGADARAARDELMAALRQLPQRQWPHSHSSPITAAPLPGLAESDGVVVKPSSPEHLP